MVIKQVIVKYYPYGECRNSPPPYPTDKLFTSQRLDGTGLYYYGARYYDASIGRFISADTVVPDSFNPQSLNRYSYCLNNPLKYVDPTGHQETDWMYAEYVWALHLAILKDYGIQIDDYNNIVSQILIINLLIGNTIPVDAWVAGNQPFAIGGEVKLEADKPAVCVFLHFGNGPLFTVAGMDIYGVSLGPFGVHVRVAPGMHTSYIEETIRHECAHNWEQAPFSGAWGFVNYWVFYNWGKAYYGEIGLRFLYYLNLEVAYRTSSGEVRAENYAGQGHYADPGPWWQRVIEAQMKAYEKHGILPFYGPYPY